MEELIDCPLLCFVFNKIGCMNQKLIHDLVIKKYDEKTITNAKRILEEKCTGEHKDILRHRRGDTRKTKDAEDIISFASVCPTDSRPSFVVSNLRELPQVSFDYVDVSVLLQELLEVKSRLASVEEDLTVVKVVVQDPPAGAGGDTKYNGSYSNVVTKARNHRTVGYNAHGSGSLDQLVTYGNSSLDVTDAQNDGCDKLKSVDELVTNQRLLSADGNRQKSTTGSTARCNSFPETTSEVNNQIENIMDRGQMSGNGWQTAMSRNARRRGRNATQASQVCEGDGEDGPLTVKKRFQVDLFLSRIAPSVANEEVEEYIKKKMPKDWHIICTQCKSRYDTYKSYVVQVRAEERNVISRVFESGFWPKGAFVKRFYQKRGDTNLANANE